MDAKTLMMSLIAINLLMGLISIAVKQYIKSNKTLDFWISSSVFILTGNLLFVFRDVLPGFISIVLSNTLMLAAFITRAYGFRHLYHNRILPIHHYITGISITCFAGAMFYYWYFNDNILIRNIVWSTTIATISIYIGLMILRHGKIKNKVLSLLASTAFLGNAVIILFRIVGWILHPETRMIFESSIFNTLLYFSGMYIDITCTFTFLLILQHQAMQKQLESDKKYKLLAENISDVIWTMNLRTEKFTYISPSIINLTGFTVQENMAQQLKDILDPASYAQMIKDQPTQISEFKKNPQQQKSYITESQQRCKDGQYIWIETKKQLQYSDDGDIEILAVSRDISERKKSEQRAKILTTAIEQNPAAIIITNKKGTIEYVNPQFSKITGYLSTEAIGKNPHILKTNHHPIEFYNDLWGTILKGNIWKGEFYNRRKDGTHFWETATIAPIFDPNNKISHFVAVKQDITQQKKDQMAIIESENRLQELNATKDKLFSIIAHDLKNPFNAVIGLSDILASEPNDMEPSSIQAIAKSINQSSVNAYKLLENLLDWSRLQRGMLHPSIELISPCELIKDVLSLCLPAANEKEIELKTNIQCQLQIEVDREMIKTVLRNLITNAIKFTNRNGSVTISTRFSENNLRFTISDTGIGIEPENIGMLFGIDNTLTKTGTANEPGTGLGLIICKEFVEKHGGTIWAESEIGKGSEFNFTLPLPLID